MLSVEKASLSSVIFDLPMTTSIYVVSAAIVAVPAAGEQRSKPVHDLPVLQLAGSSNSGSEEKTKTVTSNGFHLGCSRLKVAAASPPDCYCAAIRTLAAGMDG